MELERFKLATHLPLYHAWLKAQAHGLPEADEIPAMGYVAKDDTGCIAMVFLRRVEGGYGQIDGLATNPDRDSSDRSQAIDIVIQALMAEAYTHGARGLIAFTKHASTIERAQKLGFQELPQTYLAVKFKR